MIIWGYTAGLYQQINRPDISFYESFKGAVELTDAFAKGEKTVCFVGSSCMYPKDGDQPYEERQLGTGTVEESSAHHAIANLAIWAACRGYSRAYGVNYFTAIQSDVYGAFPSSHFIAQIMSRMHLSKTQGDESVTIWGDGFSIRDPIYCEDRDSALQFLMETYKGDEERAVNVSASSPYLVKQVVELIKDIVGFKGSLVFDCGKPSGQRKKTLSNKKLLSLGFNEFTSLSVGLEKTYSNFLKTC